MNTLNFKILACAAIATLPSFLLLGGVDSSIAQTVAQVKVEAQLEAKAQQQIFATARQTQAADLTS